MLVLRGEGGLRPSRGPAAPHQSLTVYSTPVWLECKRKTHPDQEGGALGGNTQSSADAPAQTRSPDLGHPLDPSVSSRSVGNTRSCCLELDNRLGLQPRHPLDHRGVVGPHDVWSLAAVHHPAVGQPLAHQVIQGALV